MEEVECPVCGAKFYGWTLDEVLEKYSQHWKECHSGQAATSDDKG